LDESSGAGQASEDENFKLKKLLADQMLEVAALRDLLWARNVRRVDRLLTQPTPA